MRIKSLILLTLGVILFASCKSEFEKIRASGDPKMVLAKANAYYANEDYIKAQTLYELVIGSYRGKQEAEDIYYKYAYTYYNSEQYVLAAYYFNTFTKTYSASDKKEEINFMAAYCNYQMSPTFRLDQTYTEKAIDEFQTFINTFPYSERVKESNRLIDEMRKKLEAKAFNQGKLYHDIKRYEAAIQSFENLLKDFPETADAEQVRYLICQSAYLLANNSFVEKQEERFNIAVEKANDYLEVFPKGANSKKIKQNLKKSKSKLKTLGNNGYKKQSSRS